MHYALSLVVALSATSPGAVLPPPPDTPRAISAARADTIYALHRLYRGRRGRGWGLMAGSVGAASIGTLVWNQLEPPRLATIAPDLSGAGHLMFAALGAVAPFVIGCATSVSFSVQEERSLIRRYRAGQALPPRIRRRLKPRHFLA